MAGQLVARCDTALSSQHPQTGPCPDYPRLGMAATSYDGIHTSHETLEEVTKKAARLETLKSA
jgi:hypothetical protein